MVWIVHFENEVVLVTKSREKAEVCASGIEGAWFASYVIS
ncbi:hypothetical protein NVP1064O_61 [Vibrio phage 1.064.O._10N.261.52.E2]|nr:hypothetical protein NVP1064O_61 [Vibrio phage 1.064.O._10N.261.52.E2]AUR88127.1 hypothetical protein NVP1108O_61 [Vibrio phage 1.108.O._10N.222.51.A4]AUR89929.1 hypothetical protein NVP1134O_62 [Vibrio phage 1.134.O._10N.222.52.B8]AUR96873.1 hypothetical protein NVP1233A_60 [Vibrio phage 1.233.A._10N.261.51.E6]AUR96933.1 hypothetical protein NVP1233B_60 [Vibrio phage 1.233.B._10N.261.51.E6]AUR97623.1 hypothetical protein NVP1242O_64 [Vibrio phage 1.242.O._10N.261.54.B2]